MSWGCAQESGIKLIYHSTQFLRSILGSHELCLVPNPFQRTRYSIFLFCLLNFRIFSFSHPSLPLKPTYLGASCCPCEIGLVFFSHGTLNRHPAWRYEVLFRKTMWILPERYLIGLTIVDPLCLLFLWLRWSWRLTIHGFPFSIGVCWSTSCLYFILSSLVLWGGT